MGSLSGELTSIISSSLSIKLCCKLSYHNPSTSMDRLKELVLCNLFKSDTHRDTLLIPSNDYLSCSLIRRVC